METWRKYKDKSKILNEKEKTQTVKENQNKIKILMG